MRRSGRQRHVFKDGDSLRLIPATASGAAETIATWHTAFMPDLPVSRVVWRVEVVAAVSGRWRADVARDGRRWRFIRFRWRKIHRWTMKRRQKRQKKTSNALHVYSLSKLAIRSIWTETGDIKRTQHASDVLSRTIGTCRLRDESVHVERRGHIFYSPSLQKPRLKSSHSLRLTFG